MTREEALKRIKAMQKCTECQIKGRCSYCDNCELNYESGTTGEVNETLKMAIKALEQTNEDCISKEVVLKLIEHYNSDALGSVFIDFRHGIKFADAINKLPSIQPKKGEWIGRDASGTNFYGKCSECGQEFQINAWYTQNMNYCPNCGAQMNKAGEKK